MRYHDDNEMCVGVLRNMYSGAMQDSSNHMGLSSWKLNWCLELLQKNALIKTGENTKSYKIT